MSEENCKKKHHEWLFTRYFTVIHLDVLEFHIRLLLYYT
jgi:hypothetical protein